jgi:ribosomal protein S18 acetylase RimI-like enzyme
MTIVLPTPDIRNLRIVSLPDVEALVEFDSGEKEIDRNVARCCERHAKHRSKVFCAMADGYTAAYGFCCLSISASESKYLSEEIVRANEGRAFVPFLYIDYLAVRKEFQEEQVGTMLLMNALTRCEQIVRNVGVFGLALNALTERSARLYERYGFRAYDERARYPLMILAAQSLIDLIGVSA